MATATYQENKEKLLALMKERKFSGNKLPTEEALTQLLSCSRGTLREILRELEHSGYITKKHSIGNFIHPSAFEMRGRITHFPRLTDLIAEAGMEPRVELRSGPGAAREEPPHLHMFRTNPQYFDQTEYSLHLYFADGVPAICCDCYLPKDIIFRTADNSKEQIHIPLYDFLNLYCNQEIEQVCVHFYLEEADARVSDLLQVPLGTPLLLWEECYYNFCDEVICLSYDYFNLDVIPLSMLRRYEGGK